MPMLINWQSTPLATRDKIDSRLGAGGGGGLLDNFPESSLHLFVFLSSLQPTPTLSRPQRYSDELVLF